ncbi:uncharacterized protein LOC143500202 isoform X2 [Brachyhypopomus gauderio]|uniref:uncharacterized protein LOC143500202 isoform X2 n=1 Tax=Brachyhypopomus gauderio TaxID=698409 RepID=UPI00404250A3
MVLTTGVLIIYTLIHFCQVGGNENHATGYIGHSVILSSGVDPAWKPVTIRWSIYPNKTYIATWQGGKFQNKGGNYQGRLQLDSITGNLEIKNLNANDGIKYTVTLYNGALAEQQNHVTLTVREKFRAPSINVTFSTLKGGVCTVSLHCTSEDNVTLSWKPELGFSGHVLSGRPNLSSSEAVLWTSFSPNRDVTFNCTASDGVITDILPYKVKCQEDGCPSCSPCITILVLLIIVIILVCACQNQGKISSCVRSASDSIRRYFQDLFPGTEGGHSQQARPT